jgi:hypothetical protein
MDIFMGITALVGLANMAILTALLIVYIKIYKTSKAVFTLGLMFFSIMMMLQNIIAVYAYFTMAQLYAPSLYPYLLGIQLTELIGISVLLKITI